MSTNDLSSLQTLLDKTLTDFDAGWVEQAFDTLVRELQDLRRVLGGARFADLAVPVCVAHPCFERLAADPFTRRGRARPVGPGDDPVFLDLVYDRVWAPELEPVSAEGQRIFQCTAVRSEAAIALRERRSFLGAQIDEACAQRRSCRILSVACGHLRETARSTAIIGEEFEELLGLDPDLASLAEVERSAPSHRITTRHAPIGDLYERSWDAGDFDFVYGSSLYDYLDAPTARSLTAGLWKTLRARGRLLIACHQPDYGFQAYAEAFMNRQLITRDAEDLSALVADIPGHQLGSLRTFQDSRGYIGYVSIERA